jgi:bifunctional DNA-binding transcriptional regulator/antitoxin component of YhaV-PrlF toxin-antitoxin module
MLTAKVQKREKSGQMTITIPKDFAAMCNIGKGQEFVFLIESGDINIESGDIILRRVKK